MTYTASRRAANPASARRRDARADILDAVYGPSVEPARKGGLPFGLRNSAKRLPRPERLAVLREALADTEWPEWKQAIVLADAGVSYGEIE